MRKIFCYLIIFVISIIFTYIKKIYAKIVLQLLNYFKKINYIMQNIFMIKLKIIFLFRLFI